MLFQDRTQEVQWALNRESTLFLKILDLKGISPLYLREVQPSQKRMIIITDQA